MTINQATKFAALSTKIIALMGEGQTLNGKTLPEAFDAVLGKGAYAKLAGEVYDTLRAKGTV